MADFEEFLITEFNEQHNNMRQIETSMTQMVQGFFAIEGLVLAGALSLLSFNAPIDNILAILSPIFWFLFLFGHITYMIAIHSFVSIVVIDFQNTITRRYFGTKYDKEEYLYFLVNPEAESGGKSGEWENLRDPRSATAKFVGVVNSVNLTTALGTTLYSVLEITYPQVNLFTEIALTFWTVFSVLVVAYIVIQKSYHRLVFLRTVRHEEEMTLRLRHELLKRLSQKNKSAKRSLKQLREKG
jgi:hypothetical protein